MKKIALLTILFLACGLLTMAASPAVGSWDCVVHADMDYSFTLIIAEADGVLTAKGEARDFEVGPVEKINLEDNVLTFTIDNPMAGIVDFKATLDGDTMKGTFDTYDFGGEFTGTLQK